jgi:hypothetical protein
MLRRDLVPACHLRHHGTGFRLPTKSILYRTRQLGKYASHVSRLSLLVEKLILPKAEQRSKSFLDLRESPVIPC